MTADDISKGLHFIADSLHQELSSSKVESGAKVLVDSDKLWDLQSKLKEYADCMDNNLDLKELTEVKISTL